LPKVIFIFFLRLHYYLSNLNSYRWPNEGASYNQAISECSSKNPSATLLRVNQIKYLEVDHAKSTSSVPIFRVNAQKGL